jgi:hypothetical protein
MAYHLLEASIVVRTVQNERGVAMFATILILLLLSIVMVASTNTTITEKRQVRSEAIFERAFFLSESSALEAVQKLANETAPDELLAPLIKSGANNEDLLVSADKEEPENDLLNLDSNKDGMIDKNDNFDVSEIDPNNETYRVAVQMPIVGSSLGLDTSRLYSYMSYGYTESNGGRAMVKVGYKKRF